MQKNIRKLIVQKHIYELTKKYEYVFSYNYEELENINKYIKINQSNSIDEIKIKIINNKNEILLKLNYSRILKTHYLPFIKCGLMKRFIKANFIVNGHVIIDPRYPFDHLNGNFFNIIETKLFKTKKGLKKEECQRENKKFWENIFQIKGHNEARSNSKSSISELSQNDVEKYLNKSHVSKSNGNTPRVISLFKSKINLIKPILKNKNSPKNLIKRVKFNENIHILSFSQ